MNFKNKIFITFFVLLAFVLFFNINNVFAFTIEHNDEIVSFPEFTADYPNNEGLYYVVYYYNNTYYAVYLKDCQQYLDDGYKFALNDYNGFILFKNNNDGSVSTVALTISAGGTSGPNVLRRYNRGYNWWEKTHSTNGNVRDFMLGELGVLTNEYYVYSNFECYSLDYSELVFQQPVTEIQGVTIPALETAEQIPQAIATTLKILIPVGLIVLSIGFVIYLIKRVRYSTM